MNLSFDVRWSMLSDGDAVVLDPLVFKLLHGVREGGHLNYAAKAAGVSYRHAWGLLRNWEGRFGKALLSARQGRGAHLTEFGEALLKIAADTEAALAPTLEQVALDAAARLSDAADARRHPVSMVSSHSDRILMLRDQLSNRFRISLDITGSESALHHYRRGEADIAGFHLPQGDLGRSVAALLIGLLDPSRDNIWLIEKRTLGLLSRSQDTVRGIDRLPGGRLRFINRQPGSGTRLIFDALIGAAGIAPGTIDGYGDEEYTHTAVAALVASGGADVALGSAAAAKRMKLHFEPLVDERFYLVMNRDSDSALRRTVTEFCAAQSIPNREAMKADEFAPSVAVLKRVHNAGFWKKLPTAKK